MTTVSYAREWDALALGGRSTLVASQRCTTSSRYPGREFPGPVYVETSGRGYVTCPHCGGVRRASRHPHAPRWVDGRRVDCRGVEVTP